MRFMSVAAALLFAGAAPVEVASFVKRDGFEPTGEYYAAGVPGEDNSTR